MSCVVTISQPMFIPWIGLFEQIRLSDVFIHYDDVQLPQGRSFMPRVQIKTPSGLSWLTAPIDRLRPGNLISETFLVSYTDWRQQHLKKLRDCYAHAPFFELMFKIANEIYACSSDNLSSFNSHAIECISAWLGISPKFTRSSDLGIKGSGTQRLVELCRYFNADTYVTGWGAFNYLDYSQFESNGISVCYMDYEKKIYPQLYGEFTPYVSILDAIANCGPAVSELICSKSIFWKEIQCQTKFRNSRNR